VKLKGEPEECLESYLYPAFEYSIEIEDKKIAKGGDGGEIVGLAEGAQKSTPSRIASFLQQQP